MNFVMILALTLIAGCTFPGGTSADTRQVARQFEAPMARVKPAFVSTLASMGMMISSLEVHGGREVIKARKAGSEVEIELEAVSRTATRARVAAKSGDQRRDDDTASRIMRQAGTLLE
jgi:hypothetical protein